MKRNFIYAIIAGLCLASNSLYVGAASLGKVIKHKEWVTGDLVMKYTLTNTKQNMIDGLMHKSSRPELKKHFNKFVHSEPLIKPVNTIYNYPYDTITKINSFFLVDAEGFKPDEQPQIFTVSREICIRPYPDNNDRQLSCMNTEDQVLVDDIMIENIVHINLEVYNLLPGKYIAFSTMSVKSSDSEIAYVTDGNTVEFTVQAPWYSDF